MSTDSTTAANAAPIRMSMERAMRLAKNPELWQCHECDRLNFLASPCDCGGTVDKTSVEQMAASFELPLDDDDGEAHFDRLRLKMFPRIEAQVASREAELDEVREILEASEEESVAGAARRVMAELLDARARSFALAVSGKGGAP